ncbi:hypothetical protein FC34_GL001460 [Lacticaseibacillus brantae DSM 23927]|uniref:Uncharacterized protein n=1 Tax=Lacticaseibacillus brantae DSM 23927 TaxID=1423727 RepID=A0A0R2AXQ7_9LACO|nr:hypothetical protein FC34_GL001460 [Lacticaseibacillus brantae DSM 23927]
MFLGVFIGLIILQYYLGKNGKSRTAGLVGPVIYGFLRLISNVGGVSSSATYFLGSLFGSVIWGGFLYVIYNHNKKAYDLKQARQKIQLAKQQESTKQTEENK